MTETWKAYEPVHDYSFAMVKELGTGSPAWLQGCQALPQMHASGLSGSHILPVAKFRNTAYYHLPAIYCSCRKCVQHVCKDTRSAVIEAHAMPCCGTGTMAASACLAASTMWCSPAWQRRPRAPPQALPGHYTMQLLWRLALSGRQPGVRVEARCREQCRHTCRSRAPTCTSLVLLQTHALPPALTFAALGQPSRLPAVRARPQAQLPKDACTSGVKSGLPVKRASDFSSASDSAPLSKCSS